MRGWLRTPGTLLRAAGRGVVLALTLAGAIGCTSPPVFVQPTSYDLEISLDPATHQLLGLVTLEAQLAGEDASGSIPLQLNPGLKLLEVMVDGEPTTFRRVGPDPDIGEDAPIVPDLYRIDVVAVDDGVQLRLAYSGTLHQDVDAGEEAGEVHNFQMAAHVGEDGIYLAPDGYWYPRTGRDPAVEHDRTLMDFQLTVERPADGVELVAGLDHRTVDEAGNLSWKSRFPVDGLVLLGGPLERHSRQHGDVLLHAVVAPGKADVAQDILDASAEYLDRYQPLVGAYPFSQFTLLEAFFSSGFAFPGCTQIVGSQLTAFKQYRRHGYLDHELLHNWWGNGIYVDPADGNWCEALTSWATNYYGHVLDDDPEGARKVRRNHSNFLSALTPENDKPLGTFGHENGAGRGIGYQKGATVFHMLEREIGRDAMFAALRALTDSHMGRHAGWAELQEAFETASGKDLDAFFQQWVRRNGAPELRLVEASRADGGLAVTLTQGATDFELPIPLRLELATGHRDVTVELTEPEATLHIDAPADVRAVELDPDYHLFRRLAPDEIMPTSIVTHRADDVRIVMPDDDPWDGYVTVRDDFDDEDTDRVRTVVALADVAAGDLTAASLVLLGDTVKHPDVKALLARTKSPVTWNDSGFAIGGETYDGAGHAVFFTVHHPDVAEGGITVYYGNSPAALSNARVLGFYPNSLLVFESDADAQLESGDRMPHARVVRRIDFEFHDRVEL